MNVGNLCRLVPSCQPHELLGFRRDSLYGTLISFKVMSKVVEAENAATSGSSGGKFAGAASRRAKFNANK